jgi:hypothetical protein
MNIKPLPPLTRLLTILLKWYFPILVIALIGDMYSWYEYNNFAPGVDVEEVLLASDLVNLFISIIHVTFLIILGVTFLRWIYRANLNLRILSSAQMKFTPGWSVGWYFIPFANLYKPYQAMKEIWTVAHRGMRIDNFLLYWWWAFWIISNFAGKIAFKLAVSAVKAGNAQSYKLSAIADFASDGFDIFLTYIALLLVMEVSKAYCSNYAESSVLSTATLPAVMQSAANISTADSDPLSRN